MRKRKKKTLKNFHFLRSPRAKRNFMALPQPSDIKKVAIPATYWDDKYLKGRSWFAQKDKMYYEGEVVNSYFCTKRKGHQYKVHLLTDNSMVWMQESEIIDFDFAKKPSDGILVVESESENSDSESTGEDNIIASITRKRKKPTKSNGVGRGNTTLAVVSR